MNIDDVKDIPDNITIDMVFEEQKKLMKIYGEIEGSHYPVNLDTKEGQRVVKDFLWRITEEVGEALDSNLGLSHQKEELADAFHFLIELFVLTEVNYPDPHQYYPATLEQLWVCLALVGRTCKNKPWKQTQIPIDRETFIVSLLSLNETFIGVCQQYFDSHHELFQYYFKKAQVNKFRQRSNY